MRLTRAPSSRPQRRDQRRVVGQHRRVRMQRREALHGVGAAVQQGRRAGAGVDVRRRQPRPLAALGRAGDAHGDDPALGRPRAAGAVGQKALGAGDGDESAGQRRGTGDHPAAMQVAHAVGRARPPDRVIVQPVRIRRRHPHLAGARGGQQLHGSGKPRPRNNWAVSNSGSPTTPE